MRLKNLEHGHGLRQRLLLGLLRLVAGAVPDIVRTMLYRPEWFGTRFSALTQQVMRGPSEWSVGERELFAAFVSRQNQCPF